jgi:hypothetical protein
MSSTLKAYVRYEYEDGKGIHETSEVITPPERPERMYIENHWGNWRLTSTFISEAEKKLQEVCEARGHRLVRVVYGTLHGSGNP